MNKNATPRRTVFLAVSLALTVLLLSNRGASAETRSMPLGPGAPATTRFAAALTVGTPQNLTNDSAVEAYPTVVGTAAGDIVVAWQQDVPVTGGVQQDIFARIAPGGGAFNSAINITNDTWNSREPNLVNTTLGVYVFFHEVDPTKTNYRIKDSILTGGTWSAPTLVYNSPNRTTYDVAGVQTTDGKIWITWQNGGGGTWTDALVLPLGGTVVNLSNDGSAVRNPAIAAGANGQLYVGWADHANEKPGIKPGIHIRQWNGSTWLSLPLANNYARSAHPSLALSNGNLYLVWRDGSTTKYIKERVWNGSSWNSTTTLASGPSVDVPQIFIPSTGNIYVSWASKGAVYLKKNGDLPVKVSGSVTGANTPALFVDGSDRAYVVFQTGKWGGDIWYVTAQ